MPEMEIRAYVTVPRVDVDSDAAGRLLDVLCQRHPKLGPVLGGTRDGLEVIVSTEAERESLAAVELYTAVMDVLDHAGLEQHYASRIELEQVEADELTPATV